MLFSMREGVLIHKCQVLRLEQMNLLKTLYGASKNNAKKPVFSQKSEKENTMKSPAPRGSGSC